MYILPQWKKVKKEKKDGKHFSISDRVVGLMRPQIGPEERTSQHSLNWVALLWLPQQLASSMWGRAAQGLPSVGQRRMWVSRLAPTGSLLAGPEPDMLSAPTHSPVSTQMSLPPVQWRRRGKQWSSSHFYFKHEWWLLLCVSLTKPLDWWLFLAVSVRVFSEKISLWISGQSKLGGPPHVGGSHPIC